MQKNKETTGPAKETEFTGMHLSEIADALNIPGDEEEIVNEQEQNKIVNEEEEENQTTNKK